MAFMSAESAFGQCRMEGERKQVGDTLSVRPTMWRYLAPTHRNGKNMSLAEGGDVWVFTKRCKTQDTWVRPNQQPSPAERSTCIRENGECNRHNHNSGIIVAPPAVLR